MKNKTFKVKDILIFSFIVIVCFSNIFSNTIGNLDELWNYNFARNIHDGLVPYRDFNIVQMPLLSMICAIALKIFGNQLIVMRFLAVILMSLIFFTSYKILGLVTDGRIANFVLIGLLVLYKDILCIDYNYAVLLITLILLYIELKNVKEGLLEYDFKYNFVLGLIAGLAILCKQTTGIAVSMACIGYKIFAIRNKDDIKIFLKIAFARILGVILPVIIFMIYLVMNNAVKDFVDYTILGLKTFSNKIPYTSLFHDKLLFLIAIIVPVVLLLMFEMLFRKKYNAKIYVFFAYAISSFVVTFPISDKIHFLTGSLITILAGIYIIFDKLMCNKKYSKNFKLISYAIYSFASIFLILIILFTSINNINEKYIQVTKEKEIAHFINIPENLGLKTRILEIDNYILENENQGKKVYILDAEAVIYTIPLDIYNKDYDMFLKGNLGGKGEKGIIDRINKEEKCVYLIKKDYLNWQNPNEVREYIINNLRLIDEVSIFYVFEK